VGRALVPSEALAAAIDAHAAPVVAAIRARDSGSAALTLKGSRDAPADAMACGALHDGGISPNLAVATSTRAPGFRMRGRFRDSPFSYRFTVDEVPPYLPLD
jgi:hypothetical protein